MRSRDFCTLHPVSADRTSLAIWLRHFRLMISGHRSVFIKTDYLLSCNERICELGLFFGSELSIQCTQFIFLCGYYFFTGPDSISFNGVLRNLPQAYTVTLQGGGQFQFNFNLATTTPQPWTYATYIIYGSAGVVKLTIPRINLYLFTLVLFLS